MARSRACRVWRLKGGAPARATIVPESIAPKPWGVRQPDNDPTQEGKRRRALAAMAGCAICELADLFDPDEPQFDLTTAAKALRHFHPARADLRWKVVEAWLEVLRFLATPRVWRTADAFARRLVLQGTIEGFPTDCISNDNSPVPGVEEGLTEVLGPSDTFEQHAWLLLYIPEE